MEINKFSHGIGQTCYHFVWCPKYRYKILAIPKVKQACGNYLREIANKHGFEIHELQVMNDHIHLFVSIKQTYSVSYVMQLFKGYSSYKLFKQFPHLRRYYQRGHLWSAGKFFRSVGNVTADTIQHYIRQSQGAWKFADTTKFHQQHQTKLISFA